MLLNRKLHPTGSRVRVTRVWDGHNKRPTSPIDVMILRWSVPRKPTHQALVRGVDVDGAATWIRARNYVVIGTHTITAHVRRGCLTFHKEWRELQLALGIKEPDRYVVRLWLVCEQWELEDRQALVARYRCKWEPVDSGPLIR